MYGSVRNTASGHVRHPSYEDRFHAAALLASPRSGFTEDARPPRRTNHRYRSAAAHAASIDVLRPTVEHYPDRAQGYLNLAPAYKRTGDAVRARGVLDPAAARFPNDPDVRRRRVGPLPLPSYP
jgi:hypothetical protein